MMRRTYTYPGHLPVAGWLTKAPPTFRTFTIARLNHDGIDLHIDRNFRSLHKDDIPAIVVSRNEEALIPAFLTHYRRLGVTRFLWVDDASTDGSKTYLNSQPDVDLYSSNVRFKASKRGRVWREMLVERYGKDRWYVSVDTDEFLIYRNHETHGLQKLVGTLESRGIFHMPAPMIDMYPPGRVSDAHFDSASGQMPWEVASRFDPTGYTMKLASHALRIRGGVRRRAFGFNSLLTKFPVLFWQSKTHLPRTIHEPAPFWRNFEYPLGGLLHFKFFSDFKERFEANVANAQHFGKAFVYKHILDRSELSDALVLENETSGVYGNAEDLYHAGFFADWQNG
jgi:hypothetical protein